MQGPIAVTGATGFVGSHLVRMLRAEGLPVRGVVRAPGRAAALRALGCQVTTGDVQDRTSLVAAFEDCAAVVHLVAVIRERGAQTFEAINRIGVANAVAAASAAGCSRFVHLSALGAAPDGPRYLRSKWAGEQEVRTGGLPFVIFRPSILVGRGGGAATQLADVVRFGPWYPLVLLMGGRRVFGRLAALLPIVPVLGSGRYRSMPVALDDVLPALRQALERDDVLGGTYEIGGPEALTYDALIRTVAQVLGLRRVLVHLPGPLARAVVALFSLLPDPPITREEAAALFIDNVCDNAPAVRTFGLTLRPVEQALREALAAPEAKSSPG
ncbi:MAG: NAD(P)H-binding protein [Armatimonadota bacterium]|nr:NAD(P)H-binding protein [Armatimonadota bacterium]MDR7452365.1 NAD(P)H-binding protein [Armatimonadota bacterium]MDR7466925.1 NAD(P)H-binding protein [Armatimonadota bacterium]MDR7493533.1 NAD(P)H-binding protein [Armatimonadota bacterium]MDR7498798.1 NAD(P)H-binding protein [Armatimonadota bacterium]